MWGQADIEAAVDAHPRAAAEALAALTLDDGGPPLDPAALDAVARMFGRERGAFWVEQVVARGRLAGFAAALAAQGVAIDFGPVALDPTSADPERETAFLSSARRFRCRIMRGAEVVGSGTLVGPTTVLTACHVVREAVGEDDGEDGAAGGGMAGDGPAGTAWPAVDVLLSDGRTIAALVPPQYASPCGAGEERGIVPADDDAVADRHDVAVLRLERPAGALLGTATLPAVPTPYRPNAAMRLVHYPDGADHGIGIGTMSRIRKLTARWSHSAGARPGSSGGGCFDASFALVGIHQGRDDRMQGRLVPVERFHARLVNLVAADAAPPRMWSLDGTPGGELVIGRQDFFAAFAAARPPRGRVRGIRIKRADATADLGGLPFAYRMLDRLVARSPETRLVRLSFETLVPDLADEIARRAIGAGLAVPALPPRAGVADGDTAPEAAGADRGRRVAEALDLAAEAGGVQLWLFVDHPAIAFGDAIRAALEAFIDQALRMPRLRLAIAGYEAAALPGLEFEAAPLPGEEGAPGFMTDVVAGFGAGDVRLFLADVAAAAGRALSPERTDELIAEALGGLPHVNRVYAPWLAAEAGERLRPAIRALFP